MCSLIMEIYLTENDICRDFSKLSKPNIKTLTCNLLEWNAQYQLFPFALAYLQENFKYFPFWKVIITLGSLDTKLIQYHLVIKPDAPCNWG